MHNLFKNRREEDETRWNNMEWITKCETAPLKKKLKMFTLIIFGFTGYCTSQFSLWTMRNIMQYSNVMLEESYSKTSVQKRSIFFSGIIWDLHRRCLKKKNHWATFDHLIVRTYHFRSSTCLDLTSDVEVKKKKNVHLASYTS